MRQNTLLQAIERMLSGWSFERKGRMVRDKAGEKGTGQVRLRFFKPY